MKISRSAGYGLLAIGYIMKHKDEGIILSQTISKEYNIPLEYLLKILQQLVKANILRSKRGPNGGFSLTKTPRKITMLQVIEAVDGSMSPHLDLEDVPRRKFSAKALQTYKKAVAQTISVFGKAKIVDLV
ncbi:MAG: RrF2 family transcriptional regulator [Planctomycetota bacterium]|jgi:Rrf2 family protein